MSNNSDFQIKDGVLIRYTGKDKDVVIPNSVTSIGHRAFEDCESLTSITIPNSVTSIGHRAFEDCESLTSITIPDSVTSIGDLAFDNCKKLTSITIPNSVTSIGDLAFDDCKKLTSITIPNSVTSIGDLAFEDCNALQSISVAKGNRIYHDENGVLFQKKKLIRFPENKNETSYCVPDRVTSIGNCAFSGCKKLTSITIPNSVTSIGNCAFWGCKSLTSITIPDSVTSIEYMAFRGCESLTSITIPDSVTSIGDEAFWGCESLTNITIPDSVTSIGNCAFCNCESVKNIKIVVPDGNYIVVRSYDDDCYTKKTENDVVAAIRMLRKKKMDTTAKMPLNLKFTLALMIFDFCEDEEAKAYLKKMLTRGVKALIDDGNLGLLEVLLEKTDFVTKKNINTYIQYAIDQKQQEIYLTLIHHKDEIGAYTEISRKFRL